MQNIKILLRLVKTFKLKSTKRKNLQNRIFTDELCILYLIAYVLGKITEKGEWKEKEIPELYSLNSRPYFDYIGEFFF